MNVANGPATQRRHRLTLSASQLVDEAARREMGARIRELRDRSPWKQHHMADKIGVGLRMWQRIEYRGTTDWERVEQIAEIFNADPRWIWDGEKRGDTPDVLARLPRPGSQLDRIEAKVDELLRNWDARWALLEADETDQETSQSEPRSARGSSSRDRSQTARG